MADEIGTQSSPRMHSSPHNHHPLEQPEEDENEGSAPTISASRVNFSNHNTPTNNSNMNGNNGNAVIDVESLELKNNSTDVADGPVNSIRRKWEYFPGKNHFYCDGRVMTAPSIRFCVLSFALILVTFSLFIVFDAPFLTERLTVAIPIAVSILFVSVVVNMVKTSFSDPGILPRASQQEADHLEKSYYSTNFRPPPRTKDIVVNGQVIKSKYCFTCKMFRPPRASHCGICDNCVDRFDHHCPFLGNCIGKRNYRSFYAFIVSLSFLAVFILSASIAHLVMLSKEKNNFLEALRDSPSSAVVILISFFGMWTVIGLTGFHTYLIAVEQTTNEDIKGLFGRANAKNPFSHGNFCQNCCFVLCGPSQPSLIDPRGLATAEFIASLPRKGDHNGMLSPEKTQQHTQVVNKLATNNGINGEFHQPNHGGSFIGGGTNKIFREHPPSAQTVQPIQHQPLQFSSSSSSTAPLEVNPDVHSSKSSVSGLPSLPPEEKMLLKGPIRNGRMDYRQTIPDSSGIEEIQLSPQEEPVISPSAASTVSLSTLSTSNLSTNNDYDVVVSPVGGGDGDRGVVGKVPSLPPSVRHQFNKNTRLNNGNHSKRLFPSSSIDQLDDVIDPSDFDDDLDMPSLSNINEIEISRRPFNNVRASNNNKSVFSGGDHLTKSTRSLPSTSLEENFNGRASAADIHKIHQLPITTSKSSVNNIKASSSSVRNLLVNKSGPGRGTKSNSGDGVNSNNKKRSHDSTMQNSPLHLDTIM